MIDQLLALDGGLLLWIQEHIRCGLLDAILCPYTKLGDMGLLWIVLSLGMLFFPRTRKAGFLSLCAMLLGMVCTNLTLKPLISRTRPWLAVEGLVHLVTENDPNSFPSGHTCAAFAAAAIWYRTLPKKGLRIAAPVLAALMGLSRLYVGVHYPSDVLVGMAVGLVCGWIVWKLYHLVKSYVPRPLNAPDKEE